jgi:hypothetical protein
VPVAGIGEHHLGCVTNPGRLQFVLGSLEHRLQLPEVRRDGHHLGGDHELMLVGDRLGVVALDEPAQPLTTRESGSVTLIRPCGIGGGV